MTFKMSEQAQTIKIFNLRSDTNEFIGAGDAYIPPHTGLPANCTDIAPPDIPASHIAIFDAETQTWSLHEDHRGEMVYDTTTGNQVYISAPGPLPENVTSVSPGGEYQKWDGKAKVWVKDEAAEKQRSFVRRKKPKAVFCKWHLKKSRHCRMQLILESQQMMRKRGSTNGKNIGCW